MRAALRRVLETPTAGPGFDALVMAAAVADFRPSAPADRKIQRTDGGLTLELVANPDLLAEIGRLVRGLDDAGAPTRRPLDPRPILVGFAAETGSLARAAEKLAKKRVDLIVANDVAEEGSGFGTPTNRVTLVAADGTEDALPLLPKREVAERILDRVVVALDARDAAAQTGGGRAPAGDPRPVSATPAGPARLTVLDFARMHADGERIAMLTAYDFPTAQLVDEAGIPAILVGDSLGQVLLGYDTTVRVTMEEMLHHTKAVVRGTRRAMVVGDMPFLSYATPEDALANAGRFLREAGAQAVKVEGGVRAARVIETLVRAGIPVMGHIGLTPQAINALGKVRVQGRSREQARALLHDALAVQEAGAFAVVVELVPEQLAAAITARLRIPTIGIGAGAGCAGQIQVITDVLGLGSFVPAPRAPVRRPAGHDPGGRDRLSRRRRGGHLPGRRRSRAGWTRRSSTRSWAGRPSTGPGPRTRSPGGSRSTATCDRRARGGRAAARRRAPGAPTGPPLVVRSRAELAAALARAPRPLGLVPTMGWLHAGHRSLIARARAESATVAVSIFVNPRQFGSPADLDRYPRNEARDLAICAEEGVDLVWAPGVDDVFPAGFDTAGARRCSSPGRWRVRPARVTSTAWRPSSRSSSGWSGPDRAYFGMKDAQQLRVIARMATDLALATVVPCPTVREPDGLAMSSRNVHLAPAERAAAAVLHRALQAGRARRDGRRARRRGDPGGRPRGPRERAARRRRVRLARRRRDARRARAGRRPGAPLARRPLRGDPPHRQRRRCDLARAGAAAPRPEPGNRRVLSAVTGAVTRAEPDRVGALGLPR